MAWVGRGTMCGVSVFVTVYRHSPISRSNRMLKPKHVALKGVAVVGPILHE